VTAKWMMKKTTEMTLTMTMVRATPQPFGSNDNDPRQMSTNTRALKATKA
jgi:hypothetical protein